MHILDVRIENLSREEVLEKIGSFLSDGKFHQINTVNAEIILKAQKDEGFKNILNRSDLNVADSISIRYAFLRYGKWLKCRFPGADLMHEALKIADAKKLSVFLATDKNGLSSYEETREALSKIYPNINFSGGNIDNEAFSSYQIPSTGYQILFCAFGAPYQEKFINSLKDAKINVVAMGIGGSFDFVAGKIRRAPKMMRCLGLEWLWRFVREPKYRFKRIINAVIVFPIKVLLK